jgi:hypothetical protein
VFAVIDFYNANQNWLTQKYTRENGFTQEHLLIPDNRGKRITWRSQEDYEFSINNFDTAQYKRIACNYVILPDDLNEEIEHDDIVSKIAHIRLWYESRQTSVPQHLSVYFEHIEALPTYQVIEHYKHAMTSRNEIETGYFNFLVEYFSEEKVSQLCSKIERAFKDAFRNNP